MTLEPKTFGFCSPLETNTVLGTLCRRTVTGVSMTDDYADKPLVFGLFQRGPDGKRLMQCRNGVPYGSGSRFGAVDWPEVSPPVGREMFERVQRNTPNASGDRRAAPRLPAITN